MYTLVRTCLLATQSDRAIEKATPKPCIQAIDLLSLKWGSFSGFCVRATSWPSSGLARTCTDLTIIISLVSIVAICSSIRPSRFLYIHMQVQQLLKILCAMYCTCSRLPFGCFPGEFPARNIILPCSFRSRSVKRSLQYRTDIWRDVTI